jgi:hypothetical protein
MNELQAEMLEERAEGFLQVADVRVLIPTKTGVTGGGGGFEEVDDPLHAAGSVMRQDGQGCA